MPADSSSDRKTIADIDCLNIRKTAATISSSRKPVPIGPVNFPISISIAETEEVSVSKKLLVMDWESRLSDTIRDSGTPERGLGYISIFSGKHREVKRKPAAAGLNISQPCPPKACFASTMANTDAVTAAK